MCNITLVDGRMLCLRSNMTSGNIVDNIDVTAQICSRYKGSSLSRMSQLVTSYEPALVDKSVHRDSSRPELASSCRRGSCSNVLSGSFNVAVKFGMNCCMDTGLLPSSTRSPNLHAVCYIQ